MRVALYARVSTEEQALRGLSIDAQLAALREAYPDGQEYVDLGISARKPITKRPELQRLLKDVKSDKIDLICFTKLDRWTRNVREYYKAQDVLDAHKVAWRAIQEDYETETATGKFKVNVMLAVAQQEADRTGERVKAVFEEKRKKGLVPTGSVPLGVKIENGKYVPSEDAQTVRELFDYFISTRSTSMCVKRYGRTGTGIRNMIRNERYITAGVVSEETFNKANEIIKERSQRHVRYDRVYIFSGLVFCPVCGHRMSGLTNRGYVYYRCVKNSYGACQSRYINQKDIEKYLLAKIMPSVKSYNVKITKKAGKRVDVSALRRKQDKLTDLYMNDLISRDKYADEYKNIQTTIEEAEKQPKPIDTEEIKTALEAYHGLSDTGKKAFWSALVKRIVPTENGFDFTLNYT